MVIPSAGRWQVLKLTIRLRPMTVTIKKGLNVTVMCWWWSPFSLG